MARAFEWAPMNEENVYHRAWEVVYPIHSQNFEIRFGRKPELGEYDFPTLLETIHHCMKRRLWPVSDLWIITQSIHKHVLIHPHVTRNWDPQALKMSIEWFNTIRSDLTQSMRIE